ncbi:DEAD/DEAH box helicase [Sphingomicrobium arenosum]|uniref:DEAD/DEAH box helicase n=1 Tax=Sphingomicrobium arenosum TaxID=2233861 RepID=UPI002240EC72|nr:DEAD/DEAH box helicase [Sphingomicrobium arenosum]
MSFFAKLGLAKPILHALQEQNYTTPTPIQEQSIPALLEGRDLMGIAQTGTGKTAAFSLPSIHRLLERGFVMRQPATCRMLVLSPTRELAAQIATSIKGYSKGTGLKTHVVFGGKPITAQARGLSGGTDILVATPGRLLDLIDRRALTLRNVEIFVLDEADQMMDLGFIKPLQQIARMLPKERQSLFFSATMPKTIADLGKQFISNPVRVEVTPQSSTAERIDQSVTFIDQREKQALLTLRLRDGLRDGSIDRALVFTRTKHGADRVVRFLVGAGIEAAAIHGNKSQGQRTAALNGFREGKLRILVATDIAARGIDVPGVSHVFNFELPNVPEQYVHRIGRTARAGREGVAMSFCAPDEKSYLRDIERLTGVKITPARLPDNFNQQASELPKAAPRGATQGRWTPMGEDEGEGVNSRPPHYRRPSKGEHRVKPRHGQGKPRRDDQGEGGERRQRKPFAKKPHRGQGGHGGGHQGGGQQGERSCGEGQRAQRGGGNPGGPRGPRPGGRPGGGQREGGAGRGPRRQSR